MKFLRIGLRFIRISRLNSSIWRSFFLVDNSGSLVFHSDLRNLVVWGKLKCDIVGTVTSVSETLERNADKRITSFRNLIYVSEGKMVAGADFSPMFRLLDLDYSKAHVSAMEEENSNNLENLKQLTNGKPPRHLSGMRHCISSARLVEATDLVS